MTDKEIPNILNLVSCSLNIILENNSIEMGPSAIIIAPRFAWIIRNPEKNKKLSPTIPIKLNKKIMIKFLKLHDGI